MTTVITFLGLNPRDAIYLLNGQECKAPICGVALAHLLSGTEKKSMLVLATDTALKQTYPKMQELLQDQVDLKPVEIKNGNDSVELWEIFDKVIDSVSSGDHVIFDITHGFRHLAFLSFLAAAYLRIVKNVNIVSVLYGNLEGGETGPDGLKRAKLIDLTAFVSLFDWMISADQFINTGNARRLAELLQRNAVGGGKALAAADTLDKVSLAAFLCQPQELGPHALELPQKLLDAESELQTTAKPYRTLGKRIIDEYGAFGYETRDERAELDVQLRMIKWYKERNQLIQTLTLAREWMYSVVIFKMRQCGSSIDGRDCKTRESMARVVDGFPRKYEKGLHDCYQEVCKVWPEHVDLETTLNELRPARNMLDHAGYNCKELSIDEIKAIAEGLTPVLDRLHASLD